jgi:hypothetical protein
MFIDTEKQINSTRSIGDLILSIQREPEGFDDSLAPTFTIQHAHWTVIWFAYGGRWFMENYCGMLSDWSAIIWHSKLSGDEPSSQICGGCIQYFPLMAWHIKTEDRDLWECLGSCLSSFWLCWGSMTLSISFPHKHIIVDIESWIGLRHNQTIGSSGWATHPFMGALTASIHSVWYLNYLRLCPYILYLLFEYSQRAPVSVIFDPIVCIIPALAIPHPHINNWVWAGSLRRGIISCPGRIFANIPRCMMFSDIFTFISLR